MTGKRPSDDFVNMSETRSIQKTVELAADPAGVFDSLITPSAIRQWWNARRVIVHAVPGGNWVATWGESEDDPDYLCGYRMTRFERPGLLEFSEPFYQARGGPLPFPMEQMVVQFLIEPTESGSRLSVTQDGFPIDASADEYIARCQTGWETTLQQLKEFLES